MCAPPPDPRTGLVEKILEPLELIHALTTQIPDPGQHMVRYYGWYSNRSRGARAAPSPSRASWARLLRRIFEIDPLLCPACGSKMKIVSVITEPNVIDAILRHLAKTGGLRRGCRTANRYIEGGDPRESARGDGEVCQRVPRTVLARAPSGPRRRRAGGPSVGEVT